jgi:two-component system, sensor histidine kinase
MRLLRNLSVKRKLQAIIILTVTAALLLAFGALLAAEAITLAHSLRIMLLALTGAGLMAFLMASRLHGMISVPVIHLAQTAKAVTLLRNYGIRAEKSTEDELGRLIDGFNEMLAEIQKRDHDLRQHSDHLEDEVCARTAELRQVNVELTTALRQRASI